ncbi:MAG: hypothetical protein U1F18_13135 [Steroidobacteraceae bacterium]
MRATGSWHCGATPRDRRARAALPAAVALVLVALAPRPAQAIDGLVIEARRVTAAGASARDVTLAIDLAEPSRPATRLQAARIDLDGGLGRITRLEMHCASTLLDAPRPGCARLQVRSRDSPIGPLEFVAAAGYDLEHQVFDARGRRIPLGGGLAQFTVVRTSTDWSVATGLDGVTLPGLRNWLSKFVTLPPDLAVEGRIDGRASLRGRESLDAGQLSLTLSRAGFSNEAGTTVGENLAVNFSAELAPAAGGAIGLTARIASAGGQALAGPVLLDLGANPLVAQAQGQWRDGLLTLEQWRVDQLRLLQASGRAQLGFEDGKPLVRSATLELPRIEMPAAYTSFLQIALAATDFGTLDTSGTLAARIEVVDDALRRVDADLDGLQLRDTRGRLWMKDLRGALHWAPAGAPKSAASHLQWSEGGAYGLAGGAARLEFAAQGLSFALLKPTRLPIFDGAIAIRSLAVREAGTDRQALEFEGDIEPISMPKLARAFGWPEFAGTLSGRIPRIEFRDKLLTFGGDLEARVFDGTVVGRNIRLQDPLGRWPRLFADIELKNLDLLLVTRTFEIGSITGRLEGQVRGLELFAWAPVAFDAYLQTPPGLRGRKRISARAVGTLSNVGGGGGGVVAALQSGVFKMFDEYDYEKLGIRCRLANDVCQMSGVEPAGIGYYILKGSGVPRINIIGNSGRVNWPQLVSQLSNAGEAQIGN